MRSYGIRILHPLFTFSLYTSLYMPQYSTSVTVFSYNQLIDSYITWPDISSSLAPPPANHTTVPLPLIANFIESLMCSIYLGTGCVHYSGISNVHVGIA